MDPVYHSIVQTTKESPSTFILFLPEVQDLNTARHSTMPLKAKSVSSADSKEYIKDERELRDRLRMAELRAIFVLPDRVPPKERKSSTETPPLSEPLLRKKYASALHGGNTYRGMVKVSV